MKPLLLSLLLLPFLAFPQTENDSLVDDSSENSFLLYEQRLLNPDPAQLEDFKEGLAEYNEQYHEEAPYGARVYSIVSGPNAGKYIWLMGPFRWCDLDAAVNEQKARNKDWENNVLPHTLAETNTSFWRLYPEVSGFPAEFEIHKLLVKYFDLNRFERDRMMKLIDMLGKLLQEKYPDTVFGTYSNILPGNEDAHNLAMVFFFDDYSWLNNDFNFKKAYEEFYGSSSLEDFIREWKEITRGEASEIWIFEPTLSGLDEEVKLPTAAED